MKVFLSVLMIVATQLCLSQEPERKDTLNSERGDSLKYDIDEVVVIGTRATERIIDIPYSVFKVDRKELGLGKKVSAKDVLADVPGLFLQSRYGNHDLRISIRGFGTRSNSGARGVRILQDGIPESEPDGETVLDAVDFSSLGGVEVVKGNLSSLYANAPGGVINFVSDLYFPENYVASTNQYGKYGLRQNGFRLGLKGNDQRFLLSYQYRNLDGYRQHSNEYLHLANAVYETYLSRATITILGNFVKSFTRIPGTLTEEQFTADPFRANPLAIDNDFRRESSKGRLAIKIKTPLDETNSNELEVTGYGGIKELEKAERDYTFSTRYSLGALLHLTNRSEILNRKNALTIGMDYAYQSGPITAFDNLYGQPNRLQVNSETVPRLSNLGFYFLNHLNLIPARLDLFLSGRFDKDVFSSDILVPLSLTDTSRTFEKFTPKIGLSFKVLPSVALYTSYGLSYDFPALSELANTDYFVSKFSLNPDLDAQTSYNFEVGVKGNLVNRESEFMRKLFFEVTFFNYLITNEIVPYVVFNKPYYRNAARTNRKGLEVGIKSEPFEGIEVTANYTFTHFRYEDYKATIPLPNANQNDSVITYKGNTVPSVPKHILNLIVNYEFELSETASGLLQWDCDYITEMFTNDGNSERVSSYFYGNAMVGINLSFGRIGTVTYAGINNIFDKRYVGFVNVNDFSGLSRETGEPRTVYSGLRITFKL